jgi:uncharacterized phage-associated protein
MVMQPRSPSSELPADARDIANYVLDLADNVSVAVSNLALQKILFFCHGNFLVHYDLQLFHNPIEAWKFGPVTLLRTLRHTYGDDLLEGTRSDKRLDTILDQRKLASLDELLRQEGKK